MNGPKVNNKFDLNKCTIQFAAAEQKYTENTLPIVSVNQNQRAKLRRASVPPKPESRGSSSIVRSCLGSLPINVHEPLSMLQRVTEELEYTYLLDRASEKNDICERLAYVAAYAISCYSSTAKRATKPFNPLLGETFEFDRRADLGWRSLIEQVSHHPSAAAHHVEGTNWVLRQEIMASTKFRGNDYTMIPTGHIHIEFNDGKANCTFQKVTTTLLNVIVGRLRIDHHGEMNIINHLGGERAVLKFYEHSIFSSKKTRKVEGVVLDKNGEPRLCIEGYWDNYVNIAPVAGRKLDGKGRTTSIQTGERKRIWTMNPPIGDASQYNFTKLAIELNEADEAVAPTDSRQRPDQRLMEDGKWDESNKAKAQLEERQRKVRKQAEAEAEAAKNNNQRPDEYRARWFQKVQDANIGSEIHLIKGDEYWRCKDAQEWSRCPIIF